MTFGFLRQVGGYPNFKMLFTMIFKKILCKNLNTSSVKKKKKDIFKLFWEYKWFLSFSFKQEIKKKITVKKILY